jgi:regulator of replication initiation timing
MNKEIAIQIKEIKEKIGVLATSKTLLQKEKEQLKNKLDKALTENALQKEQITELTQQLQALQVLHGTMDVDDKKALSKTIEKHIADINKTITLLSQPS